MRDTARLQVLALALLGACAWVSLDSGFLDHAIADILPAAPFDTPVVTPAQAPEQPHLGNEGVKPDHDPFELLRPLLEQARPPEVWILETPPEAYVG